ncbi:hypothetical protein [Paraburkholderia metrosideri]|uniref:Twin-arginine translocation pathway signal protein n=1 Tax=Paraburkholderia metrosideri TaxID=580937 RepID=A0ABM8P5P8_9BURK|nr:hypothetical protein [Paraburkholderia metrosideri]CAD6557026.1 hypothetical protein LMG28140_06043 [Paraburkholderia metrosideri]
MNEIDIKQPVDDPAIGSDDVPGIAAMITPVILQKIALAIALAATVVSLGIAVFTGLQGAGSVQEQVGNVAVSTLAVFCLHLMPMFWRIGRGFTRFIAVLMWIVALPVVLKGQADFVVLAHQHAADQRAEALPSVEVLAHVDAPVGRSLTSIAQEVAKVRMDLAWADERRCTFDCTNLRVQKMALSARLAALNTEAAEAKRREAEEDRLHAHADQIEALHESHRADPVTSQLAPWVGTTEAGLNVLLAFARAVVVEGAACLCWCFAAVAPTPGAGRAAVASGRKRVALDHAVVADGRDGDDPGPVARPADIATAATGREPTAHAIADLSVPPIVDRRLEAIHKAVVEGTIKKPTQEAIRNLLGCRQAAAGLLRRQYKQHVGSSSNNAAA